ncbi:SDR family oxidoreductase [Streptomyces sp. NPDC096013]|uniref:SDR family oxidoreductase n=1 Tax=Streptomyces sp. NPDC096013 TaxID=3366069 RepID=UPI003810BFF2
MPGSIDTHMLQTLSTETLSHFPQTLPMTRRGAVEENANVTAFLLSDEAPCVWEASVPVAADWHATS